MSDQVLEDTSPLTAVVLAAGAGSRMKSRKSKVLHRIAGRALLQYPVLAALRAGAKHIVVVASPAHLDDVHSCVAELGLEQDLSADVRFDVVMQSVPRGSGDAARSALPELGDGLVLVLNGDAPLIEAQPLRMLVETLRQTGCDVSLLSCCLADAYGYGRVLRDDTGAVTCIREQKDASATEAEVREVNAGLYCASAEFLRTHLPLLRNTNAASEFYVTDLVELAARRKGAIAVEGDAHALKGVNDRVQLHDVEQLLHARIADRHRRAGVTIAAGALIDDQVEIGNDTWVGPGVALRGRTIIASGVSIEQGCVITDSMIDEGAEIRPYSVVTQSRIGRRASVGPFAHVRPNSELGESSRVGNFVELKASQLSRAAKVNHLSYVGDSTIGEESNIGAGTIFCNYDGFSKHRTVVGRGVFIGSDSQLVAPVTIGDGAFIATGSTVTEDVPDQALVISRGRQVTKPNYAPELRDKLAARADEKGNDG